jgi:hypothetical protein
MHRSSTKEAHMKRLIGAAMLVMGMGGAAFAQERPCMADAARLCPDVQPGQGQLACLKEHKEELSAGCKKKVMQMKIKQEEQKQLHEQEQQQHP